MHLPCWVPAVLLQQVVQPNDGLALRSGQEDDYRRDSIERDEKRLAELGRKTIEMYVISHIITEKMEVRVPRVLWRRTLTCD